MDKGNCSLKNHQSNPYSFVCVDASCQHPQKYACLGCIAFHHPGHKLTSYDDIYSTLNINDVSAPSNSVPQTNLIELIERKRQFMLKDLEETVLFLDMVQFEDIYEGSQNNQQPPNQLKNLQMQFSQIKDKPFHSMNNIELSIVLALYEQMSSQSTPDQNQSGQQPSGNQKRIDQINAQYNKNKKSILNYINTYREQIQSGQEPQNYSDILKNSKVQNSSLLQEKESQISELTSKIAKLEAELKPLRNRNSQLEEDNSMLTVKFQSLKETNETLKGRQASQQASQNQQVVIQSLQRNLADTQNSLNEKEQQYNTLYKKSSQLESDNDKLKEAVIKLKFTLDIYQAKYEQLVEAMEKNKRENALSGLRQAILEAQREERIKQELRRRQQQQGVEVTECNVQ